MSFPRKINSSGNSQNSQHIFILLIQIQVCKECWGIQRLWQDMRAYRLHSVIHCQVRGAVVCNFLCSVHPICWCDSVMLVMILLIAAASKYSVTCGRWHSLSVGREEKCVKGSTLHPGFGHVLPGYLASNSGLSPMSAVSTGSCINPVFMSYLTVINIHRKLSKKDVLEC